MIASSDLRAAAAELRETPVAIDPARVPTLTAGHWRTATSAIRTRTRGSVQVIPVFGYLAPRETLATRIFGGTPLDQLRAQVRTLSDSSSVGSIVLLLDSPGGSVAGVEETWQVIREASGRKRVVAVVDSLAASAAYFLASAADEIVVTPSGEVGSIGVYTLHADWSRNLSSAGIKPTIIKAGEHKAEGNPYEPLGDDARAHTQSIVDDYYRAFVRSVARGRGVSTRFVEKNFGQGRTFTARRAVSRGMADRVGTLDEVVGELQGRKPSSPRAVAAPAPRALTWDQVLAMAGPDDLRAIRRAAFHEAGHGVLDDLAGNGVSGLFVTVEVEGERITSVGGASLPRKFSSARPDPISAAAGFAAEEFGGFEPSILDPAFSSDREKIEDAQRALGQVPNVGRAIRGAKAALRVLNHELFEVAEALQARGQLSGPEAERIIAGQDPGHEPPRESNFASQYWNRFGLKAAA